MNGPMPGDESLEARMRELLFDVRNRRDELNDLLREHEEARPIAARLLLEDAALISHLRVDTARRWAEVLQPPHGLPSRVRRTSDPRSLRRRGIVMLVGLAAACVMALLWIQRDPVDGVSSKTVASPEVDGAIGWLRPVGNEGLSEQAIPVVEGREIEFASDRARIDLDNGVVLSVSGPARMAVRLNGTRLWQVQVVVHVPPDLGFYMIETDEGRFVDVGTIFSVSVQPDHQTEMAVLSGKVRAELTTFEGDVLNRQLVEEEEGAVIDKDGATLRRVKASDLRHDAPIPADDTSLNVTAAYRAAVDAAEPLLLWDFDEIPADRKVPNRAGPELAGLIQGDARFEEGAGEGGFLRLGRHDRSGWIDADGIWSKPDPQPFTIELWARPDRVQWGHLIQLRIETNKDPVSGSVPTSPVVYFCMEFTRSGVFGQGPNKPAIRTLFRSPATQRADLVLPGAVNTTVWAPDRYAPGRWHHLVARVGPHVLTLFVNGSVVARKGIKRPDHGEQELHLRLGRLFDDGNKSRQFVGAIDEVALYDRALTDEEVLKHYQAMAPDGE